MQLPTLVRFVLSFSLLIPAASFAQTPSDAALADAMADATSHADIASALPAGALDVRHPEPVSADISTSRSIFIVERRIHETEANLRRLRNHELESVELKFYPAERHRRGGLYFQAIHHRPGHESAALGGDSYDVPGPNGATIQKFGLNFDDYQFTFGVLHRDFNQLWGNLLNVRRGFAGLATAGSFWGAYRIAKLTAMRTVVTSGEAVSQVRQVVPLVAELETNAVEGTAAAATVQAEIASATAVATRAVRTVVPRRTYAASIARAALRIPRSPMGIFVGLGMATGAAVGLYEFYTCVLDRGCGIPFWNGVYGETHARRDWLHRVLSQAYDNATAGARLDAEAMDIEAVSTAVDRALSESTRRGGSDSSEAAPAASALPAQTVYTLPSAQGMDYAVTSFRYYFSRYVEQNAEDIGAPAESGSAPLLDRLIAPRTSVGTSGPH